MAIRAAVAEHYGLTPVKFEFLPLGLDVDSILYKMLAVDGNYYFVKMRFGQTFYPASLFVPSHLQKSEVPGIAAPLPTLASKLWVVVEQWAVALYPFITGRSSSEGGLAPDQWQEFGSIVRHIHDCPLPPHIQRVVRRDQFVPAKRDVIDQLERFVKTEAPSDDVQLQFVDFWRRQRTAIMTIVQRVDKLGRELQDRAMRFVLCHADMHLRNVHVDSTGELWLVDWDEVTVAPKERDLMFAIGGVGGDGVGREQTTRFMEGYGQAKLDIKALAYYRAAWALKEIATCGEKVCLHPDLEEETRQDALSGLQGLFEPGRLVDIAMGRN